MFARLGDELGPRGEQSGQGSVGEGQLGVRGNLYSSFFFSGEEGGFRGEGAQKKMRSGLLSRDGEDLDTTQGTESSI